MKEVRPENPFCYASLDASKMLNSGLVIVTGGSIKIKSSVTVGIHAKISHDKRTIKPHVIIEDLAMTTSNGKKRAYLFFEVKDFGLAIIQDMPVPFRDVVQSDGGLIHEKASELAGNIVHSLVFQSCKKIRFNLTPRHVTCSICLKNSSHLPSVSAFEWSEDEDVGHFFELRS